MAIPVPQYIRHLATEVVCEKDSLSCKIQCPCGCKSFAVYKNVIKKSPQLLAGDKAFEEFVRRNRNRRYFCNYEGEHAVFYRKNIFGMKIDKTVVPIEVITGDKAEVIKIKCQDCQSEYVLFDSRYHGYEGMFVEEEQKYRNVEYSYRKKSFKKDSDGVVEITYAVMNDESLEEFIEATGIEADEGDYSNAFGWIEITGNLIDHDNKEVVIFCLETA